MWQLRVVHGGNEDEEPSELDALVRAACSGFDTGLRSGIPQLFRQVHQLQVLPAATLALHALRRMCVPLVRRVQVSDGCSIRCGHFDQRGEHVEFDRLSVDYTGVEVKGPDLDTIERVALEIETINKILVPA